MKNKTLVTICIIVLLSAFLSGGVLFLKKDTVQKNYNGILQYYLLDEVNTDRLSVNKEDLNKYFMDKYFEEEELATFSSFQGDTEISLGELTGGLRILSSINIDKSIKDQIETIFYNYLSTKPNLSELTLLYFESFLYKGGVETKTSSKEAENILRKYYDSSNKLFSDRQDQTIDLMLSDTGIALDICNNYGLDLEFMEDVKRKVVEIFYSEQYFNLKDLEMQGMPEKICWLMNKLNISINELKIENYQREWLSVQDESLLKFNKKGSLDFAFLNGMLTVSNFFKRQIPEETKTFLVECSKMNLSDIDYLDLDGMYWLYDSCLKAELDTELLKDVIIAKVHERLKNGFRFKSEMLCYPDEVYFGMFLCDKFNIPYSKSKIENNIKRFISREINENFMYENYQNVRNVFYTVLLAKHLNMKMDISDDCLQIMNLFTERRMEEINNGNHHDGGFTYGNLFEINMVVKTFLLLDKKLETQTEKSLKQLLSNKTLNQLDNSFSNTVLAYYELNKNLGINKNIESDTIEYLNKYYWDEQGYKRTRDSDMDDLISTYNVLYTFSSDKDILKGKVSEDFVKTLRDSENIYKSSTVSEYSRIETVFYGVKLEDKIKEMNSN